MYIYTYKHIYIYIYTHKHIYIHIHIYIYRYTLHGYYRSGGVRAHGSLCILRLREKARAGVVQVPW